MRFSISKSANKCILSHTGFCCRSRFLPHEAAHQWWGDLVTWSSYRDQWFSEGLANYCALMMLQEKNPAGISGSDGQIPPLI